MWRKAVPVAATIGVGRVPSAERLAWFSWRTASSRFLLCASVVFASTFGGSLAAAEFPDGLTKFHAALAALRAGERERPVVVLHLGDSHIALDHLTGVLRQNWQAAYGDAGRGLPPGSPYPYYAPQGYQVSMNRDWISYSSLTGRAPGPFGMSGFRVEASVGGASISLETDHVVRLVEIEAYGGPATGSVFLKLDGAAPLRLSTRRPSPGVVFLRVPAADAQTVLLTTVGDGPVALLGWSMLSAEQGVRYDSYGISGATLNVIDHWDDAIVDGEIARLAPDLIMLGYGTNEGFNDRIDVRAYGARYDALVTRLQRLSPTTSIVTLGAFDGARRARDSDRAHCRDGWVTPPKLGALREMQRQVMRDRGGAFIDGSRVMGGACGISEWVQMDPPLAWPDHVHLRSEGARRGGNLIWRQLMPDAESDVSLTDR